MNISKIENSMEKLVEMANLSLGEDVNRLLHKAFNREEKPRAKKALGWIVENSAIAKIGKLAVCQDTGLPVVFVEAGEKAKLSYSVIQAIKEGVEKGYEKLHLRPSIVVPLDRKNPSYRGIIVHTEFSARIQGIKVTLFPKGFGSENKTRLKMFNPTAGIDKIEEFIVESVAQAGPESCPPFFVGIGIGGTSDSCLLLAKKALLGRLDAPHQNDGLNKIEQRLLGKINSLKIGPMGLGGKFTALAVKIKTAPTHIAGLPVGVNISCHALRRASMHIK